jgi:hypothetical protein
MLSARALAEKSADMPRRISLWLASCRSASVPAVLSFAEAGSPRRAAASKRASVSIRLSGARFALPPPRPPLAKGGPEKPTTSDSSATLDLRSVDTCFAHLHTGRSETRSNHRSTFYRTALDVSTAFESSSQSAERHRSGLSWAEGFGHIIVTARSPCLLFFPAELDRSQRRIDGQSMSAVR